jgi:chemotaxis signal transduction protein
VDIIYLRGIALWEGRMIILLNIDKILYADEKETLEDIEQGLEVSA